MALRVYAAAVLLAVAVLWATSGTAHEHPLLDGSAPESVRALEAGVVSHPRDAERTRSLAQAYLDARQPGLAVVLVEGAPEAVRDDVRVEHVYARALIDQGRNDEALVAERRVVGRCRILAEGGAAPTGCDTFLLATAIRRADFLGELLSLGVEDARAHPEATLVAYQNATREARVALE
jgi:hypothetical protein